MARHCWFLIIFCLGLGLTGCSTAVLVGPFGGTLEQATSFNPPPGKAGIYLIRDFAIVGAGAPANYDLDLVYFASIRTRTCVYATIPPGDHYLRMRYINDGLLVHMDAGKNYFFLAKLNDPVARQLSESDGERYVNEYK